MKHSGAIHVDKNTYYGQHLQPLCDESSLQRDLAAVFIHASYVASQPRVDDMIVMKVVLRATCCASINFGNSGNVKGSSFF